MDFKPVDRLPRVEWAPWWDKTLARWRAEGLDDSLKDNVDLIRHFGLDPYWQWWFWPDTDRTPRPAGHGLGVVEDIDGYRRVRETLFAPQDHAISAIQPWARAQDAGQAVVWITFEGFFWFPRRMLGIERHMYAFFDQPETIHLMNRDLAEFQLRTIRSLAATCRPAFMTFAEDMSYNHGPMLSRGHFDEFLAPYYAMVVPALRALGVRVMVDSDGDVTDLAGWLADAGVEGVLPLERQAGVDAGELRRRYPRLLMIGHFDKLTMSRGEQAMRNEFHRLLQAMKSGGFIPSVDHQTPPEVSLDQYRCYLRLLEEYSLQAAT